MDKIGLNTACLQRKSKINIEHILEIVCENGFSAVEFKDQYPFFEEMSGAEKKRARDIIERQGLFCSVHLPFVDMNLSSFNEDVRKASVKVMSASLRYAAEVGAQVVTVHGGNINILNYDEEWIPVSEELTHRSLEELLTVSEKLNITLSIENLHEFSDQLQRVHSRPAALLRTRGYVHEKIGFTFDIGHANSTPVKPSDFVKELDEKNVLLSHIHDNNGKLDQHKAVGEGCIDFGSFFETYAKEKWNFPLVIETRTFEQAIVSKERIVSMLGNGLVGEAERNQ